MPLLNNVPLLIRLARLSTLKTTFGLSLPWEFVVLTPEFCCVAGLECRTSLFLFSFFLLPMLVLFKLVVAPTFFLATFLRVVCCFALLALPEENLLGAAADLVAKFFFGSTRDCEERRHDQTSRRTLFYTVAPLL